jgi:hypothetical protein
MKVLFSFYLSTDMSTRVLSTTRWGELFKTDQTGCEMGVTLISSNLRVSSEARSWA